MPLERSLTRIRIRLLLSGYPPMLLSVAHIHVAAAIVIVAICFILEYALPEDATAAIGYCGAVVLALDLRLLGAAVIAASVCTVLTWVGLWIDGWGDAFWMS